MTNSYYETKVFFNPTFEEAEDYINQSVVSHFFVKLSTILNICFLDILKVKEFL